MVHVSRTEDRFWEHIPDAFGNVEDISDALIAREQDVFIVGDYSGNVTPGNTRGLGLYYRDARHLSAYALQLDGTWPNVLLTTSDTGHSWEQVLGNHRFEQGGNIAGRCTIELHRRLAVTSDGFEERLRLTNFNPFPVTVRPAYFLGADFADIFEIRGHKRQHPGIPHPAIVEDRALEYAYTGADGVNRHTRLAFDKEPSHLDVSGAVFEVTLEAHGQQTLRTVATVTQGVAERQPALRRDGASRTLEPDWGMASARVETSDNTLNAVLHRAMSDLRMLWTLDESGRGYLAAGTPWFATLFGRDSLITALQTLPFIPGVARECLLLLASYQGTKIDPYSVEEPGKILHERRRDELSAIGELPYRRYYGSVDSTPLFLILAAEYFRWSGDKAFIESMLPSLKAALDWLENHGDVDGDGFIEYHTDSQDGLRNQGWKDSTDAVMHADGTLCSGPIALAEVQAYVYAAYVGMARVYAAAGDVKAAERLRDRARNLRQRFEESFWLPGEDLVAMALDGEKRPARVTSSNAGQVLWSGILGGANARRVCKRIMRPDVFSGWGLRTLATGSARYNPLGYHVGSVWPHDNAIVAEGLKRCGDDVATVAVFEGLYAAVSTWPERRLPELFGGHARGEYTRPVPYPVACRPQAWTAGAWFMLLKAMLGMTADAASGRLYFVSPRLPTWLREVRIADLQVGARKASLTVRADERGAGVVASGDIEVRVVERWPPTA